MLLLFLIGLIEAVDHHCLHDAVWNHENSNCEFPITFQTYASMEPQPIRIAVEVSQVRGCTNSGMDEPVLSSSSFCFQHACAEPDIVTEDALVELERIVNEAIEVVQRFLRVQPIERRGQNLVVGCVRQ